MTRKIIKAKFVACDLSVKRVGTFGVVLYHNQRPVKFTFFHFAVLHIAISIGNKTNFFGIYFFKSNYSQKNFDILQLFF